jgi:hypothetical protein
VLIGGKKIMWSVEELIQSYVSPLVLKSNERDVVLLSKGTFILHFFFLIFLFVH